MAQDSLLHAHEWETISGFVLNMPDPERPCQNCLLEPVVEALEPLGLVEDLLREISTVVEAAGEALRKNCPEGKLDLINVRVLMKHQSTHTPTILPWRYYVIKQMASSESDNLEIVDHPRCFIDLHIYRGE